MFKNQLSIAIRFTIFTAILLGIGYPLAITGFAHLTMRDKADGQLISQNGHVIGSRILSQAFTSDKYFHPRPSAAGNGYDAAASGGSNFAQSNQKLVTRIQTDASALASSNAGEPVPIDLVTTSGSGLDPDITPAGALYQVHRVAAARGLSDDAVRKLLDEHVTRRQFGVLGEARVNVLELNLALDQLRPNSGM
jgi:potassium-transporting ATPase KdpC subunit